MVGFGFSFGDFVAGIELVRQLTEALKSNAGSSREYQDLIYELLYLERALIEVKSLEVCDALKPLKSAVAQPAIQIQRTISDFLEKISNYRPSLQASGSGSQWRDALRKAQWALYRKEDVRQFRAKIQGHTSSIKILLLTLQLKQTTLGAQHVALDEGSASGERQQKTVPTDQLLPDKATLQALADMLPTLQRIASQREQRDHHHESTEMAKIVKEVRDQNVELVRMVLAVQTSLPAQVSDQKPVYFLDACGFQARIDLTFINSWEAFFAVLSVQFQQRGLKIVKRKQFVLADAHSNNTIDSYGRFEAYFIPGRKINMDAFLDEKDHSTDANCCPICRHRESAALSDQAVDCSNCGVHYQRVEAHSSASITAATSRKRKRTLGIANADTIKEDDEADDEYSQFRRLRLRRNGARPKNAASLQKTVLQARTKWPKRGACERCFQRRDECNAPRDGQACERCRRKGLSCSLQLRAMDDRPTPGQVDRQGNTSPPLFNYGERFNDILAPKPPWLTTAATSNTDAISVAFKPTSGTNLEEASTPAVPAFSALEFPKDGSMAPSYRFNIQGNLESPFSVDDELQPHYAMADLRTPHAMSDDFTAWLFNEKTLEPGRSPTSHKRRLWKTE